MYTVRVLVDSPGPNPDFNLALPQGPDNPAEIIIAAGTQLSGKYCWMHCIPDAYSGVIRAEPADDFTREFVARKLDARERELTRRAQRDAQQAQQKAAEQAAKKKRPRRG